MPYRHCAVFFNSDPFKTGREAGVSEDGAAIRPAISVAAFHGGRDITVADFFIFIFFVSLPPDRNIQFRRL